MPKRSQLAEPLYRRVSPPVVVNGVAYNRIAYTPEAGLVLLAQGCYSAVTSVFSTTLEELSTQYGLRTAVKVRQALLNAGYGGMV